MAASQPKQKKDGTELQPESLPPPSGANTVPNPVSTTNPNENNTNIKPSALPQPAANTNPEFHPLQRTNSNSQSTSVPNLLSTDTPNIGDPNIFVSDHAAIPIFKGRNRIPRHLSMYI